MRFLAQKAIKYARHPVWARRRLEWMLIHRLGPSEITIDTANGRFIVDPWDNVIACQLYTAREYETAIMHQAAAWLIRLGLPRDLRTGTIVDVGANVGMIAIGMLRLGLATRAIAVEPDPRNFRLLERNVRLNGMADRIACHRVAATDRKTDLTLALSADNAGDHHVIGGSVAEDEQRTVRVGGLPLDDIVSDAARDVALLWLDVQGHEAQAIQGAQGLICQGVPVVTEVWPYAVRRSGLTREDYCATIARFFRSYVVLDGRATSAHPTTIFAQMEYDALDHRDDDARAEMVNVLLVP